MKRLLLALLAPLLVGGFLYAQTLPPGVGGVAGGGAAGGVHPVDLTIPDVVGQLPVPNGGTDLASVTTGAILVGAGTNPFTTTLAGDDQLFVGAPVGGPTVETVPDCDLTNDALNYDQTTNAFSCQGIEGGFVSDGTTTEMASLSELLAFGTDTVPAETQWTANWSSLAITAGASGQMADFDFDLTEAGSGTHPVMAGLVLRLNLTGGAASTTIKETLRVEAPLGAASTRTYAIHSLGDIRTDSAFVGSGASPQGMRPLSGGLFTFNDTTGNANVTAGLSVSQIGNDNQVIAWKNTDVAHGITDFAETDTYGFIQKVTAAAGGTRIAGLSEEQRGMEVIGIATTVNAAKTTAGIAALILEGQRRSGTGVTTLGADSNIIVVQDNGSTQFVVDVEGDVWNNGTRFGDIPTILVSVAATTFSVDDNMAIIDGDAGGNTIATIIPHPGITGSELVLIFVDGSVTITDDNTHASNTIDLSAAFTSADDTVLKLAYDGTSWYEISRSVN